MMRGKYPSLLKAAAPGSALVALISILTLVALLALTIAIGLAFAENAPATAPAGAPAKGSTSAPEVPPSMTVLNNHEVEGILGREVLSAANENMGRIVDVIVDRSGRVRAAIIDFGGFLGVGSRKIAVEWSALLFLSPSQPDAKIMLELTRDQVKAAPEYQEGKPVVVLGALGKLESLPFE
jgi:PRC-barrel domain